jgi:hypothetical protein
MGGRSECHDDDRERGDSVANEVVAHYVDGRVVKGRSLDVDATRPACHIRSDGKPALEVKLSDLKALFFVKDLDGDPRRNDRQELDPNDPRVRGSQPVELQFVDGERLVGITMHYPPNRPFFFVVPADVESNNKRILVNRAAVARIKQPQPPAKQ